MSGSTQETDPPSRVEVNATNTWMKNDEFASPSSPLTMFFA